MTNKVGLPSSNVEFFFLNFDLEFATDTFNVLKSIFAQFHFIRFSWLRFWFWWIQFTTKVLLDPRKWSEGFQCSITLVGALSIWTSSISLTEKVGETACIRTKSFFRFSSDNLAFHNRGSRISCVWEDWWRKVANHGQRWLGQRPLISC